MCGICGFYNLGKASDASAVIAEMASCLSHRGPDGTGTWLSADMSVGLANTRLAIIDIEGGRQPMESPDGRFVIVYNGELYNFRSIRDELEGLGHHFRTHSDTEVLLAAYIEWGPKCLDRFHGMYAVAIVDTRQRELFLARDRTGIKPLYYYSGPGGFYFGSEIKAILAVPGVPRKLNYEACSDFMILGYPLVPKTIFSDIYELAPGTWLRIDGQRTVIDRYWTWSESSVVGGTSDLLERAEESIVASLKEHLVSDVPIGAFLSGGIDSSLMVALLVKVLGQDIETFTVAFREASYDESPYAEQVARHLGVRHRTITLDSGDSDARSVETILCQFDQPFGDSSAIPTYMICKEIRKHVKVALGGDGGDEMFGGYPRFSHADLAKLVGRLPDPLLRFSRRGMEYLSGASPNVSRKCKRFLRAASSNNEGRLLALSCYTYPEDLRGVFQPTAMEVVGQYAPSLSPSPNGSPDPGGREFIASTIRYALPGDYLRKIDVMSGAHGLEVRVPFLGERVLTCASAIPARLKYSLGQNKIILRRLTRKYLPQAIATKPKGGFGVPLDTWLGPKGRNELCGMLGSPLARIRQLIRDDHIQPLLDAFRTQTWHLAKRSRFNTYQQVYFLWSLETWLQRWSPAL